MFKKGERIRHAAMLLFAVFCILLIVTLVGCGNSSTVGKLEVKSPSTVTLIAAGKGIQVTYNNGYKAVTIKRAVKITQPLQDGRNYSIATFNIKPGDSACSIKIGSKQVVTSKALGQSSTAFCVIVQDKFTHAWVPANG